MAKKFKCGGCKKYITDAETWRQTPLQRFCSQECMSASQPSRQNVTRPHRKPSKSRRDDIPVVVRELVHERDRASCRFCGRSNVALHVHHINYRSEGVDHQPHNLILLCQKHHDLMHSDKKKWKPILLAWIWLCYVEGKPMRVPQVERWLSADSTEAHGAEVSRETDVPVDLGTVLRYSSGSEC